MLAQIFRLYHCGIPIDRARVRNCRPAEGDLHLRLRLRITGRGDYWDIYLATLEHPGGTGYVIPCLDRARVIGIKGRWLHLRGTEVNPRGASIKRQTTDNYPQEWWCRLAVAVPLQARQQPKAPIEAPALHAPPRLRPHGRRRRIPVREPAIESWSG